MCYPKEKLTKLDDIFSGEVTTAADSSSKTSSVCGRASKLGSKSAGGAYGTAQQSRMDSSASLYSSKDNPLMIKQSSLRVGEDVISERCTKCGMPKEEYRYVRYILCIRKPTYIVTFFCFLFWATLNFTLWMPNVWFLIHKI